MNKTKEIEAWKQVVLHMADRLDVFQLEEANDFMLLEMDLPWQIMEHPDRMGKLELRRTE